LWDLAGDMRLLINVALKVNDNAKTIKELKDFLGDIEGLEIGIKGEKVYVGGKIVIPEDMGKISLILEGHSKVLRLVELAPQTQAYIAKKMEQEIHRAGLRDVVVRVVNRVFWLEGVVGSKSERTLAYKIAEAYIPDSMESLSKLSSRVKSVKKTLIQNFISVNQKPKEQPIPKMIKITSQFVELTRDYQKIFGFKWNPLMATGGEITLGRTTDGGLNTSSGGSLMGKISQLFPQLASAKQAGNARIIQSGMILCENKIQCQVVKNRSQHFDVGNTELSKPQTEKTGFTLHVKPTILVKDNIHLDLNFSVSTEGEYGGKPSNTLNQVKSRVVIKNKESAVIGGIVVNSSKRRYDKDAPGSSTTGGEVEGGFSLFSFVRSKGYEQSKNQFAVFLTPEIVESASVGTEEIKKKFRKRTR
jgi:pilus assembly protein CpaC